MPSTVLCALILLACALTFSAAQTSCKGQCGAEYYRGNMCQCDYSCLTYGECCEDYESQCTTENSCKGRCGETFKRGRACSCDSDCVKYKQCCPDYKSHCDAEVTTEQIRRAAGATASKKTSSCNNVNDNKLKEQILDEPTEKLSKFSEGDIADDSSVPLVSSTSYPPDDLDDDTHVQIFPIDELAKNGVEDLETSPVPESTSGYELSTVDQLDQVSTEPSLTVIASTENDNLDIIYSTTVETPAESTDANDLTSSDFGTTSTQPTSPSVPLIEPSTSTGSPELEKVEIDASDAPEVSTVPLANQDSVSVLDTLEVTTIPALSTPDSTTHIPSSTDAAQDGTADNVSPGGTTADLLRDTLKPTSAQTPEPTTIPLDKTDPYKPKPVKPTPEPDIKPLDTVQTLNIDDTVKYQADDSSDTNLCSGRPVSGITTLRNGTMVVFRGHYFWLLDSNRVPGPPRGITQVWGVPSPIDTVFTRCNCLGKTYIFKGGRYWRFENDVLDPGYPRVITTGFDGLRGHITAALSVPQYKMRAESVYFFKRGGLVQKYKYQMGTSPTCGSKVQHVLHTDRNRVARQAVSVLEPAINIRASWRGFPSTVTAAVSVPSNREPEGYKYIVFSRSNSYNVRMDGHHPVIASPKPNTPPQTNNFFRCPKSV